MRAVAVTRQEGGEWIPFVAEPSLDILALPRMQGLGLGGTVHAIKFDNGVVWDTVNGWRKNARVRVKMGRELI